MRGTIIEKEVLNTEISDNYDFNNINFNCTKK